MQAAIREVPIQIFDFLSEPAEGLTPGFYFNIPVADEDKASPNEVLLEGPFESRGATLDAARDFIRDCLTNHNDETVE